jgi:hypothetical protein
MINYLNSVSNSGFTLGSTTRCSTQSQVLLEPTLPKYWLRKYTLIALYKLCRACLLYPQCYVLKNVNEDSREDSLDGGGFSDVYKGRFEKQQLCLKVIRLQTGKKMKDTAKVRNIFEHFPGILSLIQLSFLRCSPKRPFFGVTFGTQTCYHFTGSSIRMKLTNDYASSRHGCTMAISSNTWRTIQLHPVNL